MCGIHTSSHLIQVNVYRIHGSLGAQLPSRACNLVIGCSDHTSPSSSHHRQQSSPSPNCMWINSVCDHRIQNRVSSAPCFSDSLLARAAVKSSMSLSHAKTIRFTCAVSPLLPFNRSWQAREAQGCKQSPSDQGKQHQWNPTPAFLALRNKAAQNFLAARAAP